MKEPTTKEKIQSASALLDMLCKALRQLEDEYYKAKKEEEEAHERYVEMLFSPKGRFSEWEKDHIERRLKMSSKARLQAECNLEWFTDDLEQKLSLYKGD